MSRSSQFAVLFFVVASVASTPLIAQAPVDPAEPGETTRTPSGEPWRGTLQSGAEIRVDPRTNRPVVQGPGHQSQLWDGVHRLRDGTELHVRDGRVVPTTEMLERRSAVPTPSNPEEQPVDQRPPSQPASGSSSELPGERPCQALVDQACGRDNACAEMTKCSAARQLVDMAAEQRARQAGGNALTDTDLKCREALRDSFFAPCR